MTDGASPEWLASLHARLQRASATVAVAESLTGGLVLAALTETPGASATVRGGVVVYATDLKGSLAGVPPELLRARGAVDPDVAAALASGVRERLRATIGLAVTGVAGPDPQDGKKVGTVFVAVATRHGGVDDVHVEEWHLDGDRQTIRAAAVARCLDALSVAADLAAASTAHRTAGNGGAGLPRESNRGAGR